VIVENDDLAFSHDSSLCFGTNGFKLKSDLEAEVDEYWPGIACIGHGIGGRIT